MIAALPVTVDIRKPLKSLDHMSAHVHTRDIGPAPASVDALVHRTTMEVACTMVRSAEAVVEV